MLKEGAADLGTSNRTSTGHFPSRNCRCVRSSHYSTSDSKHPEMNRPASNCFRRSQVDLAVSRVGISRAADEGSTQKITEITHISAECFFGGLIKKHVWKSIRRTRSYLCSTGRRPERVFGTGSRAPDKSDVA